MTRWVTPLAINCSSSSTNDFRRRCRKTSLWLDWPGMSSPLCGPALLVHAIANAAICP